MQLRPFCPADEAEVVALWSSCGLVVPQNDPCKDIARKLKVNPELFLVGESEGRIIATCMAGYEGHRGWINYLAVHPDHQRCGHATTLMRKVEQLLHERGCPKINLQVRATNTAVIAFYEKLGYLTDDVISLGRRLEED